MKSWMVVLSVLLTPCTSTPVILNYEHSENLANAKKHCPTYAVDRELVDRDKAISFYLAYLKEYPVDRYPNLVNRAKVLAQIGLLYAQYADPKKPDVRPDHARALAFFMKAIEADPDFVCLETIYARTNLASLAGTPEARMRERIAVYRWLLGLTDERLKASVTREQELLKPVVLEDDSATEEQRAALRAIGMIHRQQSLEERVKRETKTLKLIVDRTSQTLCVNLVADASATSNPVATLAEVIRELDGHPPAELARKKMEEIVAKEAESALSGKP